MKILNLYAGIGGNRKLWPEGHEITAVENNPEIAKIYSDFFPNDKMVIGDAHQYLLEHFQEFDFIWSSPPCQTHSQVRYNLGFKAERVYKKVKAIYPDMSLYQEIILLDKFYQGKWVIENTIPYYKPLIPGTEIAKHIFWSNFIIGPIDQASRGHRGGTVETLQNKKMLDLSRYDIQNKRQILRNCVEPETGKHILNCLLKPNYLF